MRLATILLVACFGSQVFAQTYMDSDPVDLMDGTLFGGTLTNPEVINRTFVAMDPGGSASDVTINYALTFDADWVITSGVTAASLGLDGTPADAGAGIGVDTTSPAVVNDFNGTGAAQSAKLEDLDVGGVEALESLGISLNIVSVTGGSSSATPQFENATATVLSNLNITDGSTLTVTAEPGTNGARLTGFDVKFTVTAIPEPSAASLLGLVGLFCCGRTWIRKRQAIA